MKQVRIDLHSVRFSEAESALASTDGLTATVFRYRSGVAALSIANSLGRIVALPFQGQQIWDARFRGRRLTMASMFPEPVATRDYLGTYGAFFIHCGVTAMGNPSPADKHPLHGELPNAPYQEAHLTVGEDAGGPYMALAGSYRHSVAFTHNYVAEPVAKLRPDSSRIELSLAIRNLRPVPMELMYLAHVNFLPRDGAVILDTVPDTADRMRFRAEPPPDFTYSADHRALIEALLKDPAAHRRIVAGRRVDPEIVLAVDSRADAAGWAHSLQLHEDGQADFVSHRPDQLGHGVRWMTRTGDQDALGFMLPATAEADGYIAEKAKGNVLTVEPHGTWRCDLAFGALDRDGAAEMQRGIEEVRTAATASA